MRSLYATPLVPGEGKARARELLAESFKDGLQGRAIARDVGYAPADYTPITLLTTTYFFPGIIELFFLGRYHRMKGA